MAITTNMNLVQWTLITDQFNHIQLANNFTIIDEHDHTGSDKGLQIPTDGITNLGVTSAKLAPDSVLTNKILDGSVTTSKIDNLAITAAKFGALPSARVYTSVSQSIPNNSLTSLVFNSERFDTDNMYDSSTNPQRITCKTAGIYSLGACIQWAVNTTGTRQISLRVNGTTVIESDRRGTFAVDDVHQSISTIYKFSVNDYIEVVAKQTSGVDLDIGASAQYSPEFYAAFLSN